MFFGNTHAILVSKSFLIFFHCHTIHKKLDKNHSVNDIQKVNFSKLFYLLLLSCITLSAPCLKRIPPAAVCDLNLLFCKIKLVNF